MRSTVTFLITLIVALFAVGSAAGSTSARGEAPRAAPCGYLSDEGDYLSRITHRHDVSCKRAKQIEQGAARAGDQLCQQTAAYHAWTVTYIGPFPGFDWKFTRGAKSFEYAEQGGC
jgi:hypothetical protein